MYNIIHCWYRMRACIDYLCTPALLLISCFFFFLAARLLLPNTSDVHLLDKAGTRSNLWHERERVKERERGGRACDGWVGVGRDSMEGGGKGWRKKKKDERYKEVKTGQNI
jgi:hypothetical protein